MKNRKARYLIEAVALVVMVAAFVLINKIIDNKRVTECVVKENNGYNICVEKAEVDGSKLKLSGWCLRGGIDTMQLRESTKMQVILMNRADNSEKYFISTDIAIRNDVNEQYNDNYDHSYSGFEAEVRTSKIDLSEKDYEILIYYITWGGEEEYGVFGIRTGYSIVGGKLVRNE